ncbi:MAG: bifunctional hydroxymethylpyrimidine kinase/phosphomethylpyrimidine kinase, partial [Bacteroidetes bacterium QS_1_65_9]
ERAKRYVTEAIRHALPLGHGRGPTNHFFHLDPDAALLEAKGAGGVG